MPTQGSPIPFINEHEAADMSPNKEATTPEEQKIIKKVQKLFSKSKHHRERYDQHWLEYYKMFRGRQWTEKRPTYRHSEVINLVFQSIQHSVPIMSDARPRIGYLPQDPTDFVLAEILEQTAEHDWERNNWGNELLEVLYETHIYGTGFASVEYDPDLDQGMGSITFKSEDPFYCYPDPSATDVNKKAESFIYAEPIDTMRLKQQHPEKAEHIKPDVADMSAWSKSDLDEIRYKSPTDNVGVLEGNTGTSTGVDQTLVITAYMTDDALEEVEEEVEVNKKIEKRKVQKLKFPNGRRVKIASGVVLEDGPNPYDDGKFPYARLINYSLPREFWGISEVENLKSPQRTFNKLVSFALDVLTLMGNPIWVVDHEADIDTDNLFNEPGLIVEKSRGSEVRREAGVQLQPYVMNMIDQMERWFNGVAGTSDVSQGTQPSGVTAAAAIDLLQQSAETRLRQKGRNLDRFMQDVGQMYLSRLFQFYSVPRVVRITNREDVPKFFKIAIEPIQGEDRKQALLQEFQFNNETGEFSAAAEVRKIPINGKFDVRVATGSSLPFSKQERVNKAFQLFDRQAIDVEELLKSVDYPNWEAVLARITKQQQELAAQQAQQGGQQ